MIKHGNVGRDPAVDYDFKGSGKWKTNFSLAVKKEDAENLKIRKIGDRETEWWECEIWGELGPAFADICRKGASVVLVGDPYTYAKNNGETQKCLEVKWFATPSLGGAPAKPAAKPASKPAKPPSGDDLEALFAGEDEIAF